MWGQTSRLQGPPFRNSRESVPKKLGRWGRTEFKFWVENQYSVTHHQPNQMEEGEPGEVLGPSRVEAEGVGREHPMLGSCSMNMNHPLTCKATHARDQVNDHYKCYGHRLRGDTEQTAPRRCAWDMNMAMLAGLPHSRLTQGVLCAHWPGISSQCSLRQWWGGQGQFCLDLILGGKGDPRGRASQRREGVREGRSC